MSETQLYQLQCVLIALFVGAYLLVLLVRGLRRLQPGLAIGRAISFAFGLRIVAALLLSQTPVASQLRGGDEKTFVAFAKYYSRWDFISTGDLTAITKKFHIFFFSMNYRVFDDVPDMMLRFEVIAFAVAGIALLAAAVYELAGRRAALITAWVIALEPSHLFFSGLLHKEPFMMFAEGMVAFGGAILWKRGNLWALAPMVLGCLVATATRPYVGWFLAAAAAFLALHASLRRQAGARSLVLGAIILALMGAFVPTVWNASSKKNLKDLQASQDANATDRNANLSLERVDFSSRDKVIVNLPKRVLDIATKPYPWQLGNTSQRLGLLGTVVMFVGLIMLIWALLTNGASIMRRAGPLVYPSVFLLAAYSLSAGNAGTAFRYRTHLVAFLVALLVVLREHRWQERQAQMDAVLPSFQPVLLAPETSRASAHTLAQ